jgi:carlactone synthase/all-trans-10'-apo-beta-carotenal 13,14-cleaving dioxygenase
LAEDDGVLMAAVVAPDSHSYMLFLDAGSFEELARAHLPYGLPGGFHGTFVPQNSE